MECWHSHGTMNGIEHAKKLQVGMQSTSPRVIWTSMDITKSLQYYYLNKMLEPDFQVA